MQKKLESWPDNTQLLVFKKYGERVLMCWKMVSIIRDAEESPSEVKETHVTPNITPTGFDVIDTVR